MKMDKKARTLYLTLALLGFGMWMFLLYGPQVISGQDYNSTFLMNTTVNITNAAPLVTAFTIADPINLNSYNITLVTCNITAFDYDNDTLNVNAYLYVDGPATPGSTDDGNNHYTNSSCSRTSPVDLSTNYTCGFDVQYYADNSSQWYCR